MSTTITQLDEQYKRNQNELYDRGLAIANRPYQGFAGSKTMGFTDTQRNIFGNQQIDYDAARMGGQNARTALAGSFQAPQAQVGQYSFTQGNIQDYMNPYVDQVIDRTFRQVDRATDARRQAIRDNAISQKAFGNDRRLLMEGVAEAEGEFQKANLAAQLRGNAFTQGANLMQQDLNRAQQADAIMANNQNAYLAGIGRNAMLGLTDAQQNQAAFAQMADAEQQIAQANLNQNVEEFYREQGYDEQQARFLADLLYGQQVETTTTGSGYGDAGAGSRKLGNAVSGASLAYMAGAGPVGMIAGAVLGGLL